MKSLGFFSIGWSSNMVPAWVSIWLVNSRRCTWTHLVFFAALFICLNKANFGLSLEIIKHKIKSLTQKIYSFSTVLFQYKVVSTKNKFVYTIHSNKNLSTIHYTKKINHFHGQITNYKHCILQKVCKHRQYLKKIILIIRIINCLV